MKILTPEWNTKSLNNWALLGSIYLLVKTVLGASQGIGDKSILKPRLR